jgi:hypothetical protein
LRDFTLHTYKKLLEALIEAGYEFQTVEQYIKSPSNACVIIRHDSDFWPMNDLNMAKIEYEFKVQSTYYFRVPNTYKPLIIKEISDLNHEIGYHYEDLVRTSGNVTMALKTFEQNLGLLRSLYPVKTISRHGRPLSTIDSLSMWNDVNYKKSYELLGEVYLDIDYSDILYLTDNGSRWNGHKSNIRDKVAHSNHQLDVYSTFDLIEAIKQQKTPKILILNCHAGRWNNNLIKWSYRYIIQSIKNLIKAKLRNYRDKKI